MVAGGGTTVRWSTRSPPSPDRNAGGPPAGEVRQLQGRLQPAADVDRHGTRERVCTAPMAQAPTRMKTWLGLCRSIPRSCGPTGTRPGPRQVAATVYLPLLAEPGLGAVLGVDEVNVESCVQGGGGFAGSGICRSSARSRPVRPPSRLQRAPRELGLSRAADWPSSLPRAGARRPRGCGRSPGQVRTRPQRRPAHRLPVSHVCRPGTSRRAGREGRLLAVRRAAVPAPGRPPCRPRPPRRSPRPSSPAVPSSLRHR